MIFLKRLKNKISGKVKYDESFFSNNWFSNWKNLKFILKEIIEINNDWKTILDYGCGPGIMIDFMNDNGFKYFGYDSSSHAHQLYLEKFGKNSDKYLVNYEKIHDYNYDLCISFDVFEHMTDQQIIDSFSKIKNIRYFLFNISREKGIPGHINLKNDEEWVDLFYSIGLEFDEDLTINVRTKYITIKPDLTELWQKNIFVFKR